MPALFRGPSLDAVANMTEASNAVWSLLRAMSLQELHLWYLQERRDARRKQLIAALLQVKQFMDG